MHPPLNVEKNPLCVEQITAFKQCMEDYSYFQRILGSCNEQKRLLDKCFKSQKKVVRKGHLDQARADRERWRQACSEIDAPAPPQRAS